MGRMVELGSAARAPARSAPVAVAEPVPPSVAPVIAEAPEPLQSTTSLSDYPEPAYYGFLLYPGHHRPDLPELVVPDDVARSPLLIELQRNDRPVEQLTYDEAQIPLSLVARADSPEQLEHFLGHCLRRIA